MKFPKEKSVENINYDYQFLRANGVCAKTALKMVGMGYSLKNDKY